MIRTSVAYPLTPSGQAEANNPAIGWQSIVTISNIEADGAADGYPVTNLANPATASKWIGADDSEQHVEVTIGTSDPVDYLAVAGHNFGTGAIAVSVEGATTPDSWFTLVEAFTPNDDRPIIFRFKPFTTLVGIRLKMAAGDADPQAAVLYVGKLLIMPRRIYVGHTPITYGRRTSVTNGRSESGAFLGRVITGEHVESSISMQNIDPAFYRSDIDPFIEAAQETPFFFAWRPVSYPAEVGFVAVTNDPQPVNQRPNGMVQIEIAVSGVA